MDAAFARGPQLWHIRHRRHGRETFERPLLTFRTFAAAELAGALIIHGSNIARRRGHGRRSGKLQDGKICAIAATANGEDRSIGAVQPHASQTASGRLKFIQKMIFLEFCGSRII